MGAREVVRSYEIDARRGCAYLCMKRSIAAGVTARSRDAVNVRDS